MWQILVIMYDGNIDSKALHSQVIELPSLASAKQAHENLKAAMHVSGSKIDQIIPLW